MTTYGIEFEFSTDADGLVAYKAFKDRNTIPGLIMDKDHARLAEFKSEPLSSIDYETVVDLRCKAASTLERIGVPFTYYGCHVSAFGFSEPKLIPAAELIEGHALVANVLAEYSDKNVYIDPFVDGFKHAIHVVPKHEVADLLSKRMVDLESWKACKRFMGLMPSLRAEMAWRPVPGGTLRILNKSRIELVMGWLPERIEKRIIDGFRRAVEDQRTPMAMDDGCIPIVSSKNRFGLCWLSGWTYKAPEIDKMRLAVIDPRFMGNRLSFNR